MLFRRKKKTLLKLKSSFGQIKTEGFNFDLIKRYHNNESHPEALQVLSDQTCNDLDHELFFCYADRTYSKVGQQYLYDQLRTIDYSSTKFKHQEEVIQYFNSNPNERLNVQYQLNKLNHHQAYYITDLFQQEIEDKPSWYFIFPLFSGLALASILLSFFNASYIFILLGLLPVHVFIHYGLKRKTNLFLNSIPALLTLGSVAKHLFKKPVLKKSQDIQSSLNTFSSIRRKMSIFKLDQKVDSDMEAAYWFLIELIKITFLLEPLLLFSSLDKLRNKSEDIKTIFQYVGRIDSYISISSLREGTTDFCIPIINNDSSELQFKDIAHPLVPNCITNSLDTPKSVLLTGSNMSGKTTFIRAIGLNYLSGITLNTCFASTALLPIAKLYSVIRIEDDLMSSSSYFYREVDEINKIIDGIEGKDRSIILLDELFKGTNTIERIAAAKAVLSYLEQKNSQIFVATHDIELTEMLHQQFELFHFTESIVDSTIQFDYKIKRGTPKSGNAIKILDINGFPQEIIEEANMLTNSTS